MEGKNEYEVGHGRPPKHTRFKLGTSGNPKGRPRSRKNLATVFDAASNERVSVTENGKRKTITILEAIMKQVTRKAAAGISERYASTWTFTSACIRKANKGTVISN